MEPEVTRASHLACILAVIVATVRRRLVMWLLFQAEDSQMGTMVGPWVLGVIVLLGASTAVAPAAPESPEQGASVKETASDLLEKGIYAEETVGDLDAAMKIYRKIVDDEKANRVFASKAEYRLATCLLKQGKKNEAQETFEDLVNRFPDVANFPALRSKIEPDPRRPAFIQTIRDVGYRFDLP